MTNPFRISHHYRLLPATMSRRGGLRSTSLRSNGCHRDGPMRPVVVWFSVIDRRRPSLGIPVPYPVFVIEQGRNLNGMTKFDLRSR